MPRPDFTELPSGKYFVSKGSRNSYYSLLTGTAALIRSSMYYCKGSEFRNHVTGLTLRAVQGVFPETC